MSATSAAPTITRFNLPTRLNIGPLTTTFTPPPQCSTLAAGSNDNGVLSFGLGESCSASTRVVDNTSCWPPVNVDIGPLNLDVNGNVNGLGFYSPGFFCPVGYTTACTQQLNGVGTAIPLPSGGITGSFQFELLPSETAIGCCPTCVSRVEFIKCYYRALLTAHHRGYTCGANPSGAQTCVSAVTAPLTAATCAVDTMTTHIFQFPMTETITSSGRAIITAIPDATAYAPMIQLNWQSSDDSSFGNRLACAVGGRTKRSIVGRIVGSVIGGWIGGMMTMGMGMMVMRQCRRRHRERIDGPSGYAEQADGLGGKTR